MKILIINHYVGSENHGMEYRHYYLAKEWSKEGHNVSIVGASYSHLRKEIEIGDGFFKEEKNNAITFYWLKTNRYVGNGFKRVFNMFYFCFNLFRFRKFIENKIKPDVILISSPHPFAIFQMKRLASKINSKLIFEVRDLWPLTLLELGNISKLNPFVALTQFSENYAYKNSDVTVSLLPNAFKYMEKHGLSFSKFKYIPNGLDVESVKNYEANCIINSIESKISKLKDEGHFVVGYLGTIGMANCLLPFLESKKFLKNKVSFFFVGDGNEKPNLLNYVKENNLNDIYFIDRIAKEYVPKVLSYFDSLYIGWHKKNIYDYGVSPNKIFDYAMSAKPIIHSINTSFDLVKKANCGISVEAENPKAIAEAIIKLKNMTKEERDILGENGKKYVIKNHDYKVLAKKYLDIMKDA